MIPTKKDARESEKNDIVWPFLISRLIKTQIPKQYDVHFLQEMENEDELQPSRKNPQCFKIPKFHYPSEKPNDREKLEAVNP